MVTWSCLEFPFALFPTLGFLAWFDSRLTFEDHVRDIVSRVSQRIGILRLVKRVFVDTSVYLRCYYSLICCPNPGVLFSCVGSAAECHFQLLERQVYSVARLCPDQTFLSLCHRRHVAALCMLYKVNSNSNHLLFSELRSASVRVRIPELLLQLIH